MIMQTRQCALAKAENSFLGCKPFRSRYFNPLPVTAFASLCILLLAFITLNQTQFNQADLIDLADIEILMTEDNLEFYEDLGFYEWLLLEQTHSS